MKVKPVSGKRTGGWSLYVLPVLVTASLLLGCFGAKAQLRRRGIPIDQDQLVSRATSGDAEVVDLLVRAGVAVDGRNSVGHTALLAACDAGSLEVVQVLLDAGADPNQSTPQTAAAPLAVAAARGHRGIVTLLVGAGARLEQTEGAQGMTALAVAASEGHEGAVADLLEAGSNVNAVDSTGWTPLHHAVREGQEAVVRQLLGAGADAQQVDRDGWSAWEVARSTGQWDMARLLEAHTAKEAHRARVAGTPGAGLVIPPGWQLFDPFESSSPYWPEMAAFSITLDPPGSYRVLLRSPEAEHAQMFLIRGRAGPWWDHFRNTVQELEKSPLLERRQTRNVVSADGIVLELRRYSLEDGLERIVALSEGAGKEVLILDAGGNPEAEGLARIEPVLRKSELLKAVGAVGPS